MDNPLAGSSDSEDSDGSGGMFDFTDSEDASSDDGGEPEPVVDDDFMANLMPTSRLDVADGLVGALTCRSTCMYVERSETLGISDGTSHAINER